MAFKTPGQIKLRGAMLHAKKPKGFHLPQIGGTPTPAPVDAPPPMPGPFVGQHSGNSAALAAGGSALSMASKVTQASEKGCNG